MKPPHLECNWFVYTRMVSPGAQGVGGKSELLPPVIPVLQYPSGQVLGPAVIGNLDVLIGLRPRHFSIEENAHDTDIGGRGGYFRWPWCRFLGSFGYRSGCLGWLGCLSRGRSWFGLGGGRLGWLGCGSRNHRWLGRRRGRLGWLRFRRRVRRRFRWRRGCENGFGCGGRELSRHGCWS